MSEYDDTTAVTVEVPTGLLAALDESGVQRGYDDRSEAVQAALLAWVGAGETDGESDDGGRFSKLTDVGVDDVDVDVGVDVGVDE